MQLILIRHATAEDIAPSDSERKLVEKGHRQAARIGDFLEQLGITPTRILTSPLVRAKETAAHIHERLPAEYGMMEDPRLACGMSPETGCDILRECAKGETVIMVGHEPDCSRFSAHLIGLRSSYNIRFKKASSVFFDIDTPSEGGAEIKAVIPASMIKAFD